MRTLVLAGLALAIGGTAAAQSADTKTAIFAGGCFWCVEADFDKVPGVLETVSGYTGGTVQNPSYKQVSSGGTGHYEAVEITYDPSKVSYEDLLHTFWRTVDPLDDGGQFCDRGDSYLTAIFVADEAERAAAEASKAKAEETLGQEIVTPILDAAEFWTAEDYHQDYYLNNSLRYNYYRWSCGRDARVQDLWGGEAFAGMEKKD
jgi:peptide-methionine (S)-S-oxide reductase